MSEHLEFKHSTEKLSQTVKCQDRLHGTVLSILRKPPGELDAAQVMLFMANCYERWPTHHHIR